MRMDVTMLMLAVTPRPTHSTLATGPASEKTLASCSSDTSLSACEQLDSLVHDEKATAMG
jgi:hypothetical protein